VGIRHADHMAPSIRKKLAISSPTSGGRSVGIVRSRTQTMEFVCLIFSVPHYNYSPPEHGPSQMLTSGFDSVKFVLQMPHNYLLYNIEDISGGRWNF
jgi:hypothetical protein